MYNKESSLKTRTNERQNVEQRKRRIKYLLMDNIESKKTLRTHKYGKCEDKDKKEEFNRESDMTES
jgi:hypothetical protein